MTSFEAFDRSSGIGASEVPALAGLSPYQTPVGVWLRKVGLGMEAEQTASMRTGSALEQTVLKIAGDQVGVRLRHNRTTFRHPRWPDVRLFATPDGFAPGRHALVEVKVVGWRGSDWKAGPPAYVIAQVQAQLAVLPKVQGALVAALIGAEVQTFEVERDEALIAETEVRVADWWATHVEGGASPEPETDADVWALLRGMVTATPDREVRVPELDEEVIAAELVVLLTHADEIAAQITERRVRLAEAATRADLIGEGWRATWSTRATTDWRGIVRDAEVPANVIDLHTYKSPVFTFRRSGETPTNGASA